MIVIFACLLFFISTDYFKSHTLQNSHIVILKKFSLHEKTILNYTTHISNPDVDVSLVVFVGVILIEFPDAAFQQLP